MKIHCIRHEPFEGLACISEWICNNNHTVSFTHVYLNQEFPEINTFDLLIISGGTSSVYDNTSHIIEEKQFLEKAIKANKQIIGICLGAQLLASVLGAKVYRGKHKEIGWFPITTTSKAREILPFLPVKLNAFHWHGDTFDIPEGATQFGSSDATPNQGFILHNSIFAFQFHIEMTAESTAKIINGARCELLQNEGKYIQTEEQILSEQASYRENNLLMFKILDYIANCSA